MTHDSLRRWHHSYADELLQDQKQVEVDGVLFSRSGQFGVAYRYGNAVGVILADSRGDDSEGRRPVCVVRPDYSDADQFRLTVEPNLDSCAAGVKNSWELFAKGS